MTSPCLHYDCENKNSFGYCKTSACIHPKYSQQTVCGTYNATPRVVIKSTIEPQRWIPCSERLPEKDMCFYLVTIANHGLNFTTTLPDDVDVVRWDYDRRKGCNSWHWCTERTVIAWMPLPEPYKGERNETD